MSIPFEISIKRNIACLYGSISSGIQFVDFLCLGTLTLSFLYSLKLSLLGEQLILIFQQFKNAEVKPQQSQQFTWYNMPKYIYELWPGKNRFCCRKFMTGPIGDLAANSYFYCCFIVVMVPYYIFLAPALWNSVSPVIPVAVTLSALLTLTFVLLTGFTDPGIIPRKPFLLATNRNHEIYTMPDIKDKNGVDNRRFCETCKIFRPPRASHCSVCQNCVEVFDHHCPFVNNCIGKRNYRYFLGFLLTLMVTILLLFISLIIFLINVNGGGINSNVVIIICSVVIGLLLLPMFGFFLFHLYLVCTGKTTRQLIKNENSRNNMNDYNWCSTDPTLIEFDTLLQDQECELINSMLTSQPDRSL